MTYAGTTIDYGYDNDGLLTRAGDFTITRNSGNGLPESVSGGNLEVDRDFNGYGEISTQATAVNGSSLFSYSLDRDNTGRIARKTETLAGATTVFDYAYDTMGRLLTVTKDGILVEEYQYNANGARILETNTLRNITGRTFGYTGEDHLLKAGTATYTHDADGFLTSRTKGQDVTNYTYSIRGELLNVTLSNADVIEYVHDPLGRRIAKKINGTTTEKYLWQGLTRLLAVYDGSNSLVMHFEYADGHLPVAITKGGTTYYPAFDQAGTLRAVADASGNVVKQLEYDTFGNVINDTAPGFAVPFGFAGGLYDPDTGFVRFGYRDYDPDTGRWAAKDPIFFNGGDTDLYGYVQDDPVNSIDPYGLWRVSFSFGIGGTGGIGWKKHNVAIAGSVQFAINYDSNKGMYKSVNFQLVEFDEFTGIYFGAGSQIGGEVTACSSQKGWDTSTTQYDSGGAGIGALNMDIYITQDSNSLSGGGGRGPWGVGAYKGRGTVHNHNYNMTR